MPAHHKNVYLHIGQPKTGTTALQTCCYHNRATLQQHGWEYPPSRDEADRFRQQFVIRALLAGDVDLAIELVAAACEVPQENVLFSSEGFLLQYHRIKGVLLPFLDRLRERFNVILVGVFREREAFLHSLYKQMLVANPNPANPLFHYGGTLSDFGGEPVVQGLLNYEALQREFAEHANEVLWLDYQAGMLEVFEQRLFGCTLDKSTSLGNKSSLTGEDLEVLRISNRFHRQPRLKLGLRQLFNLHLENPGLRLELLGLLAMVDDHRDKLELTSRPDLLERVQELRNYLLALPLPEDH